MSKRYYCVLSAQDREGVNIFMRRANTSEGQNAKGKKTLSTASFCSVLAQEWSIAAGDLLSGDAPTAVLRVGKLTEGWNQMNAPTAPLVVQMKVANGFIERVVVTLNGPEPLPMTESELALAL